MNCGVGRRHGLDLALLWCRPAATALIGPLPWELPYVAGAALKREGKGREGQEREKASLTSRKKEPVRFALGAFSRV